MLGQTDIKEVNNSLYVSGINKIVVGDPLPSAFKIAGNVTDEKSFTTADLKLMNAATATYNYTTKGGNKTSVCKGVLLKDILSNLKISGDGIKVQINTTDSAAYPVKPVDLSEAMDTVKGYIVTYEVDGVPVNSDGKDSTNIRIYRNYGDSSSAVKNVTGITLTKESTSSSKNSTFKHTNYSSAPYNVDSITSATMTIEGPGLQDRQIVTTRQLESMDQGVQKGTYKENIDDTVCDNTYEGITVEYLLSKIAKLKSNAGNVIFWDKNLKKIGEFSFDSVMSADADGKKMMIAYGVNDVPLMFTNSDPGYDKIKHNDNGCLKLILNSNQTLGTIPSFTNISRIQVNEKDAKGIYEHTYSPYDKPKYTNDTVTITGDGIGNEVIYSVKDLENLAASEKDTLGYEGLYSLQNSANYWNNHVLKGVKLYELLLKSGMSSSLPDSTPVQIIAKDGYNVGPFTLGDIRNISKYGVYVKGMKDPAQTGLPVLLSYGADGYPFIPLNTDEGFVNGIDNNGGPVRVTFGQKSLEDINGPNQIKYVSKIIIGSDKNYTAHNRAPYDTLKDNTLSIKVFADGTTEPLKSASFKVSELEDLTINKSTASSSIIRDYYAVKSNSLFDNDFYQGVNLAYLIKEKVGLRGIDGTITFKSNGTDVASIGIDELLKPNNDYSGYFNSVTQINNLKPLLAYGKNGYPLVSGQNEGNLYNNSISISNQYQNVKNDNGPLAVIIPQSSTRPDGMFIAKVDEIVVKLAPDPCSHSKDPYKAYNKNITIKGTGVKKEVSIDALTIEEMIDYINKANYYVLNQKNIGELAEYKGVGLYDLLREKAGLQPNAEKVIITSEDGYTKEFTIQDVIKSNYINEKDNNTNLKMLVAYGKNGKPLVPSKNDSGYDAAAGNDGGALKLVTGQTAKGDMNSSSVIKNIKTIEVTAGKMVSWKHDSPMYQQYLDTTLFRITGSEVQSPVTFTLRSPIPFAV
jgi:DMSO/TMAO reductase YedYZ molybdopterin-dependent catalytic subunit